MLFPAAPDIHGIAVLLLVVVALVLFTRESIPLETSSLAILVLLAVGFELFPYHAVQGELHAVDFFAGFGHEALIAVCALMMAGQGLVRTGALEPVGRTLAGLWTVSPVFSLLLTLIVGAVLSAFVNNVPIVVLLLPILRSIALKTAKPASGILMPMGFATLVGGMSTTIGTSTNLLVISIAADLGLRRFGMFDFMVPAVIAGSLAIVYLWLIAPRMLPPREVAIGDTSPRVFIGHFHIEADSFADGKTLGEISEKAGAEFNVVEIHRESTLTLKPRSNLVLRAGDSLSVRGTSDQLKEYEEILDARLYADDTDDELVDDEHPLHADDQQMAEIVITQGSPLDRQTLRRARFMEAFQLITLALHRPGSEIRIFRQGIADVRLRVGDVLLVQGPRDQIAELKQGGEFLVLDATSDLPHTRKAPLALVIMIGIVSMSALGIMPIAISAVVGVLAMLVSGCMGWRDAARSLSTPVVMIVVTSLALGSALLKTGGADYLAQVFLAVAADAPNAVILSGLMLGMAIMTNVVSNNAAAVIGTPIAMAIASQLGLPAEPFVLAVLFGANMSYATPMAYKTNLLVMNAGGYTFSDFMRVGIPLTLILWLTLSFVLPAIYGI